MSVIKAAIFGLSLLGTFISGALAIGYIVNAGPIELIGKCIATALILLLTASWAWETGPNGEFLEDEKD